VRLCPRTRNFQRFRGGLVFKAHRHLYHSTLGLRVIKKKDDVGGPASLGAAPCARRAAAPTVAHTVVAGEHKQWLRERGGRAVCQRWGGRAISIKGRLRVCPRTCISCIIQLKAQGPSRTCNESQEEEEEETCISWSCALCSTCRGFFFFFFITLKPRVE